MRILSPVVESFVVSMVDVKAIFALAAPYERGLYVIMTRGGVLPNFKGFLTSRRAARESLRRWIKTSRTRPFWSTARQSQCCSAASR
ncbi:hypothetical protein ACVWXO_000207 [Bradyrhizobium sp. LM2.7]